MAKEITIPAEASYHVKNLIINGVPKRVIGKPDVSLLTVLRDQLKMTGTKRGCDCGQCGVCNVILNGKVVRSCITRWKNVPEFSQITTIEGIGTPDNLHALQWAMIVCGAIQCGFCTPGFILTATEIVNSGKEYTDDELRKLLSGHLCRCTGYQNIFRAVKKTMLRRLGKNEEAELVR